MEETPRDVVETFFGRMADPADRATVGDLFSEEAIISVPGETFGPPDAVAAFLAYLEPRYETASKAFDSWTVAGDRVISQGTLYGIDNDGEPFEGVRYVDVYELADGRIERLDVYNDLAVEGVVAP
jgi:ketosteroid isomerase-like protein